MAFLHANVHKDMLREAYPDRYTADPACAPAVQAAATACIRWHFLIFETGLGDGPYLFGPRLSLVDIHLWMQCSWLDADGLAENCPAIDQLRAKASARPALAAVLDRHIGPEG